MPTYFVRSLTLFINIVIFLGISVHADNLKTAENITPIIDEISRNTMKEYDIAGISIALSLHGKQYYYNYGVASKESGQQVSENTLFEIGSISKTFTATLAAYAQAQGKLALSDNASQYLPILNGSAFDHITLLDLGIYIAGGLPLQFPDNVQSNKEIIAYYQAWQPSYTVGTHRLYSNPSIGLLGYLTVQSMEKSFEELMITELFPKLGLTQTYLTVPQSQLEHYAYGYSKSGEPIRVNPGPLDAEAYGVKTTSADLLRFLEANMDPNQLDQSIQEAIQTTHNSYYTVGDTIQGLGWEMYHYPISLNQLIQGNSSNMALNAHSIEKTPLLLNGPKLINKTGSTNGFGAYVAFIPEQEFGIVILANKNYPNAERVKLAYQIMQNLLD